MIIQGKEYDIETTTEIVLEPVDSNDLPPLDNEALKNVWKLRNLKKLRIGNYGIVNHVTSLSGIENLQNLEEFEICASDIQDVSPLEKLKNLKILSLYHNDEVVDYAPVSKLTNLTYLSIFGRTIKDISCFANLTQLTELQLHSNEPQLNPEDVEALRKKLPNCNIIAG